MLYFVCLRGNTYVEPYFLRSFLRFFFPRKFECYSKSDDTTLLHIFWSTKINFHYYRLFFGDAFSTPPLLAVGIDLQLKNEIFSYCMTENEAKYVGVFNNIDLKKKILS